MANRVASVSPWCRAVAAIRLSTTGDLGLFFRSLSLVSHSVLSVQNFERETPSESNLAALQAFLESASP